MSVDNEVRPIPHNHATRIFGDSPAGALATWITEHNWVILPFLAIPILFPLLAVGLTASADGATHLMRVALLVEHWQRGVFFPRWMPELMMGLGYPVLNYYAPGTYYLAGVLHQIGLPLATSVSVIFVMFVLIAGHGMYLLARDIFGVHNSWAALLAAVAYMYAPYLLVNIFIRGAVAEAGAQALLPWILLCARRLLTSPTPLPYVALLALSLGALAVTHTVTLIIFPPFLLAYMFVVWWHYGRQRTRLGWAAVSIAASMGISSFFWIPLIAESGYLSKEAFDTSIGLFVPQNLWTWSNFLDLHPTFEYTFIFPYQLGFIQILLALAGVLVIKRWNIEWKYLLIATVVAGLAIGGWSKTIWLSTQVLLAVQFPWRLLAIISLTLPLFTGILVYRIAQPRYKPIAALVFAALIIIANRPQIDWMDTLEYENGSIPLSAIARYESITGQFGTGPTREFMPRWLEGSTYIPSKTEAVGDQVDIQLQHADQYGLVAEIESPTGGPLRFTNLYFPGWEVVLDGAKRLDPYPSTNLGLLTVDIPPGSHVLTLTNPGTNIQKWATWLTLATLVMLVVLTRQVIKSYWIAGIFGALLIWGCAAQISAPGSNPVLPPLRPFQTDELTLLGYRLEQGENRLRIYPTWYVRSTPTQDLRIGWELRDVFEKTVNLTATRPYFNSQSASNWPPGTIADDAYELILPPELPAGQYELLMHLVSPAGNLATSPHRIGIVVLESATPDTNPAAPLNHLSLQFGDAIALNGYDLRLPQGAQAASEANVVTVQPGDALEYTLYWQAQTPPPADYHGFIHIVDHDGLALAQEDHLPGANLQPPMTWDTTHVQQDPYKLYLPDNLPNGLIWPTIGLYEFEQGERLPIYDQSGQTIGDTYRLPPVKVFGGNAPVAPQNTSGAQFGEEASLLGYDLALPEDGLHPGSQFTLTLYYQANGPMTPDLTQFVHLYDAALGMAAQKDAPPLDGANPTSTWAPGEIVVDQISLQIAQTVAAGAYTLGIGLYDPQSGVRVPVTNNAGELLPDQIIVLDQLRIEP